MSNTMQEHVKEEVKSILIPSRFEPKRICDEFEEQRCAHSSKLPQKSILDPQQSLALQQEDTHDLEEVQCYRIVIMHA